MQSTALALISCAQTKNTISHPEVPRYDAVIYCDLGNEAKWVKKQVAFIKDACEDCGIPFYILGSNLYRDYMSKFGISRVSGMPFWTLDDDGKAGRIARRACTIDYKILIIQKFVRYELLGYRPGERTRPEDIGAHELHIGFSGEEKQRAFVSRHPIFVNKFPLIEMGWERQDCYRYNLEEWGLDARASACLVCPFHRNHFFGHLKCHYPDDYAAVVEFDKMLEKRQPQSKIRNRVFISRARKRITELTEQDCDDAQMILYQGCPVWTGF